MKKYQKKTHEEILEETDELYECEEKEDDESTPQVNETSEIEIEAVEKKGRGRGKKAKK